MKLSLKDLGQLAGVTPTTASRIINAKPGYTYNPVTIQRVLELAKTHGYRPNQLGRSVFGGRSMSAGVIMPSYDFYSRVILGVHDRLLDSGYAAVTGFNENDFDDPAKSIERKIIHRLLEHRVDGFIMRPTLDNAGNEQFEEILKLKLPLVVIDRTVSCERADSVGTDDVAGGRLAARHLLELGHKRIVQFVGDLQVNPLHDRAEGFEQEIMERGLGLQTVMLRDPKDSLLKVRQVFSRNIKERPTAAFFWNDFAAVGAYDALAELGLRIPRDVSILGYGNLHLGNYLRPRLSTIEQEPYQMGCKAAEIFLERLESRAEGPGRKILLPVKLLQRESTAAISS